MAKEKKDALEKKSEKDTENNSKKSSKKEKTDKKADKKSSGIGKWFKDLKIEFKNVTWPTRQTVMINSGIVLGTIVIAAIFVGLLDTGLLELFKFLLGLAGNQ
ncbi:MAG: preprotein translocase subunit SecE [Oscillospiraceae bacterium]|nr:preprotein translocase subunit SecE [Ruminococcus sp.]MDE6706776.1 preprotein translocase subunit SecE [Oscillospiraceae bacterium]MDE6777169.1 preprotein translocase subunit SecE [Oscillospiraceae bacterium]MDE7094811.1 preprotein translocase subunit SecE [Oscillospiraceae bacterium]